MQQQKQEDVELTEAASPISSRLPARGNFHELEQESGGLHEEDALVGDESERGLAGNRWPRQETLALLKIRSDMDAAFRDATVKGPLWEDVSRKLAELGYKRSARKCKEKFENVHKYYKRTKEGRVGRQHGKSYRFFSQLEALNSAGGTPTSASAASAALSLSPVTAPVPVPVSAAIGFSGTMDVSSSVRSQPPPPSASPAVASHTYVLRTGPDLTAEPITGVSGSAAAVAGISFSSNTSSSSSDSEEEEAAEEGPTTGIGKRKRSGSEGGRRKMMTFFEGLMRQVMEKQEEMQQRFLEAIEKREQDRMAREEAWKRQEMARLAHEHEILAQERAMSASREAAVIACLQQITGQTIQIAQPVMVTIPAVSPPQQPQSQPLPKPVPPPSSVPEQHQHQHHQQQPQQPQQQQPPPPQNTELVQHQPSPTELVIAQQEQSEIVGSSDPVSSSRWPKSEVLTLIKIRTGLESSYQEAGPKGPLWEEVSAQMHRLGFNRSAKRCKEKWENINKYFKKVKESNKKRPEDAKTCPYYSQLDALYQKKLLSGIGSSTSTQNKQGQEINLDSNPNQSSQERGDILAITSPQPRLLQIDTEVQKSSTSNKNSENSGGSSLQVPTSNGGLRPSFFEEGPMKKPEDIVKELEQQQQQAVMGKSDILDEEEDTEDDDDDNDEEDQRKTVYKIQFKRQNPGSANGGNPASSFLAMVQ